ncbi:MAG: choice-of-anchor tandem repeat GloVer-containing protein [Candidatus Cybelea sp.]
MLQNRLPLAALAVTIALAACGGSQPPIGAPGALSALAARTNSKNYKVLYSFGAVPDGNYPHSDLIGVGGTFYGTTIAGGANYCGSSRCGTVFSITTGGAEKVLHSFADDGDGYFPFAGLASVDGTLYGTTGNGGVYNTGIGGTVFSITTGGAEKVLHSFGSGADGSGPTAGLINVKGTLYGTTGAGGASNAGTVFSITTSGTEKVLHSFTGGADGDDPESGLIDVGGKLYGTTNGGGAHNHGTVFSITTRGRERVLHSFRANGTDGELPEAGLTDVGGTLYGTTIAGGSNECANGYGCGTVFSITTNGTEKVLHSFGKGNDGWYPAAGLLDVKGTLYGTTAARGGTQNGGTVFSITTGGVENVLHSFGEGADGFQPLADMNYKGGSLVGTTYLGGVYGVGTIFSLTP